MTEITEKSPVPFGLEKGKRLCDCTNGFLQWMVDHLTDTDHHVYAYHARHVLDKRKDDWNEITSQESLERTADALLRNAGYGKLCGPSGRRRTAGRR